MTSLISYLKRKSLSTNIQIKVRTFVEQFSEQQDDVHHIDESQFISYLSDNLKAQYVKIGNLRIYSSGESGHGVR
jgi:hypothetical protein